MNSEFTYRRIYAAKTTTEADRAYYNAQP